MIRLVIRLAFWFSLVLLILPFGMGGDSKDAPSVGPLQAFFAARDALGDIVGICERKPEVCEVGKAALQTIRARARTVYQFIDGEPDHSIATGAVTPDPAGTGAEAVPTPSQRPED